MMMILPNPKRKIRERGGPSTRKKTSFFSFIRGIEPLPPHPKKKTFIAHAHRHTTDDHV
jgi:hypothetical protein